MRRGDDAAALANRIEPVAAPRLMNRHFPMAATPGWARDVNSYYGSS